MRCRICGTHRGGPHDQTVGECNAILAKSERNCANPADHHRFRPDYREWAEELLEAFARLWQ